MKVFIYLIFFFTTIKLYSQRTYEIYTIKQNISFTKNKIYIVCRGTKRKANLIAHKFNKIDKYISHVGIGYYNGDKLTIFNVTDNFPSLQSAFVVDSLESFLEANDTFYFSIWEFSTTKGELKRMINICESFSNRKIYFDASFKISNDDTLYCSEFCERILHLTNPRNFNFIPEKVALNNSLYEHILGRRIITYFPVDFFQVNKNFKKIFEYKFIE